jgi:hypothetical protein
MARTTMTLKWIAERLKMGAQGPKFRNRLVQKRKNDEKCKRYDPSSEGGGCKFLIIPDPELCALPTFVHIRQMWVQCQICSKLHRI